MIEAIVIVIYAVRSVIYPPFSGIVISWLLTKVMKRNYKFR